MQDVNGLQLTLQLGLVLQLVLILSLPEWGVGVGGEGCGLDLIV